MAKEYLFLLDFDDTLFPTTWGVNWYFDKPHAVLPDQMDDYAKQLMVFLTTITEFGRVVIVTNSLANWVTRGSTELLSKNGYDDTMQSITAVSEIVYAREQFPHVQGQDAKFHAFKKIISESHADRVIAFGDHDLDVDNFQKAVAEAPNKQSLFVKFRFQPSFIMVCMQLRVLNNSLLPILTSDKMVTGVTRFLDDHTQK